MTTDPHGWQTMETAPRDGTAVLLWCPEIRSTLRLWELLDQMVIGVWINYTGQTGWFSDCGSESYDGFEHERLEPTRWQPLPSPPRGDDE